MGRGHDACQKVISKYTKYFSTNNNKSTFVKKKMKF